jgi:long-chain acyl-CoA synthetase
VSQLAYPEIPLHGLLQATAARRPDSTAIIFEGQSISFGQLDRDSNRLAHGLAELGLVKGDRLAIFLPNCPEFECAFQAASKLGLVPTPLNPSYQERELAYQCNEAGATALLIHETLWPVLERARAELKTVESVVVVGQSAPEDATLYSELSEGQPETAPSVTVGPDDLAALPFSSGTTGLAKGVMLTHRNLVSNHIQFGTASRLTADDVMIVYLPLSHIYGVALMGLSMWSGAKQVLMERFDLAEAVRLIEYEQVTRLYVVPPVLLALANAPDLHPQQFRSVTYVLNAAAPLAADVARRVEHRLGLRVIQAYGLTEASPDTHHSPLDGRPIHLESGGALVADTEQRIVDLETGERNQMVGETGEVLVRGPQVMQGYWNDPDQTATTIRDGWLYTGDVGWIDDRGYLYLVDRKKEMIKYKAFSIAPAELEALLLEHPDVVDCGVTGVPDAEAGEVPRAFVVIRSGAAVSFADLDKFVMHRLAAYKRIRQWEFVEQIPRTPSGKILRRALRSAAAG